MRAGCQIPAPSTSASIPTQPPGKAQQGDFHKPQCPLHAGHQALRTGSWPRATQANTRPVHPATPDAIGQSWQTKRSKGQGPHAHANDPRPYNHG
jgi:hypothetical protein